MSRQSELNSYIARLQQRLRLKAWLRGAAIFSATALLVTLALVLILNRFAFPAHGIVGARWGLIVSLAAVATLGLGWPLYRLTRARAVHEAEAAHPELEQRLTTFHERVREGSDPFLELLAADTLTRTESAAPSSLAPNNRLFAFAGAGLASLGILAWMVAAAPGFLGYGASLLWTGAKKNVAPMYAIAVTPGDIAVRRNSDQLITAQLKGLHPDKVQIFAHYASAAGWEPVAMQAQPDAGGKATYQFLFAGLPENVEYYVTAGPLVSPHYQVRVIDLPAVKSIRVTYNYPKWTGMKPVTEERSGDLRALEGTDAAIEVQMDRPLKDGQLTLDNGQTVHLTAQDGNRYQGTIHMQKDGAYHIAASDAGQAVRLSEDYFIATDKALPPEVAISRPGGDYRASPIEEVTVGVKAADTFGLKDVHLHYSVNGGPDRDVDMLKSPGATSADGNYTLRLEDFKLVPGDLVSVYATAKDGHAETRTDISFIQAEPFEREFSQSQQGGGGGGGGGGQQNDQTEISKREKELIAATWKQSNDKTATPKDAATAGQFLADAQQKLRDQVNALSARIQSRDLSQANEEFTGFEKDMQAAAKAMAPSADKLKDMQWKDAIPLEQKALQSLLRAEATFRQIQVAFGQSGGGGGSGSSAGRDLASLFDLELDTAKNQYETAQTASPAEQHEKDVESALEKLDALAKRQEELASQQHNPQQSFQERWQQEMLRREAEQLQRQMEQLAQNQQGQQGEQSQQGGQQSSSASAQSSSQSGSQSGSQSSSQVQSGSQSASKSGSSSSASDSSQQQASSQGGQQGGDASAGTRQQAGGQSGAKGSKQGTSSASSDQRIEQALSRLHQADEAMKRSGAAPQNADAAHQAADKLREATSLLGGTQQQLASGKMDALTHEAERLTQEERAQADRISQLANSQNNPNAMDRDAMMARLQERDRLAQERQQLSDDLSKLQGNMRGAAREMAPNQPGASQKLRDALTQMDQSDLDNHVQRTADWLRRGINPNSNGTEGEIAKGLQNLNQQLGQAQQAMGQGNGRYKAGQRGSASGDEVAALGQVERLRSQLEAMAGAGQQPGQSGRDGQTPGRNGLPAQNGQHGQGAGQQPGQSGRAGSSGQNGQGGQRAGGGQQQAGDGQTAGGLNRSGQPSGQQGVQSGDTRFGGGGGADGTVWGNVNTGNNRYTKGEQRSVPLDASGNPADTERSYQQSMRELNQLRQMVKDDPEAARAVQQLAQQMQRLDPSRFPGNPAMVEQMHREVLSTVDRLEMQLNRNGATDAHTGKPDTVPSGYQDAVADYYRRLSQKP
jgi:hypothetical protein